MTARKYKKPAKRPNGAGSITWSKCYRRWVGQASLRCPGQQPIRKRIYGPRGDDSSAARQIVKTNLAAYLGLERAADATARLKSFLVEFASRPTLASNTRAFYLKLVEKYLDRLGAKALNAVKADDIERVLDDVANKPRTAQAIWKLLNAVFQKAVRKRMIAYNPALQTDAPSYSRKQEERGFTITELAFILDAARGNRLEALLVLALETGLRPAHLYGLQRADLNLAERELWVRRSVVANEETGYEPVVSATTNVKRAGNDGKVKLSPWAVAALREHLKLNMASDFVFASDNGHLIRHSNLSRKWWKPLLQAAAVEAEKGARAGGDLDYKFPTDRGLYALRHTADEVGALAGVDYDLISARMGHTSLATTFKHYLNVSQERETQAAHAIGAFLASLRPAKVTGG